MKNISSKKPLTTRRKLLRIIAIAVVAALVIGGSLYALEKSRITNVIKDPFYTSDEQKAEDATKNDPTNNGKGGEANTDGVDSNKTTDEIPQSTTISISLDSTTQSSGNVVAKVSIKNNSQDGVCSFTFSKENARPVVRSIDTSSNSCEVSIPEQEFEMIGTWNVSVHYFSNNTQATVEGSVSVK